METPVDLDRELTVGFAGYYIRRKARQLIGKAGLTAADRPDLEQELALVVFLRLPKFDPRRAHWNVFAVTVIERHATTLLRSRLARKRVASFESRPVGPSEYELVDLRCDIQTIVESLPADLRCLCYDLQHGSMTDAATRLRMSRTTLWNRVKQLRRAFVRAGLGNSRQKNEALRAQSA